MKTTILALLAALMPLPPLPARAAGNQPAAEPESPAAKEKHLSWFRHDKPGPFIRWGL